VEATKKINLEVLKTKLNETVFSYTALLVGSTRYLIREWKLNPFFDTTVYISNKKLTLVLVWYRDDSLEYARQLMDMTCVDHMDRTRRFNIWYTGLSNVHQKRFNLLTSVPERIPAFSAMIVYKSLDWAEREAWDMFGVPFAGHSDLRRILTDYGFKGFPLRKNYPTVGYFEKRWDNVQNAVIQQLVTLMQESRSVNPFYDYRVKWLPEIASLWPSVNRTILITVWEKKS